MLKYGLRIKIIACFFGLILLMGILITAMVRQKISTALREQYINKGKNLAVSINAQGEHLILVDDMIALQGLVDEIKLKDNDVSYAFLVGNDGKVLAHTFDRKFPDKLLAVCAAGPDNNVILLDTELGMIRDISVPILNGKLGITHIGISEHGIQVAISSVTFIIIAIVLAVMIAGAITAFSIGTLITRPLRQLTTAAQEISMGDFNQQISIKSKDEVGTLTAAFNRMSKSLEEQREKIIALGNEQSQLQAQMFQQEKMSVIGQLSATIAHELNTPLNTILLQAQLLKEELEEKSPKGENGPGDIKMLETEIARCKLIVQNLLDFSRQPFNEKEPADMELLLEKTLQIMKNEFALRKIIVSRVIVNKLPEISANVNHLQQVFLNLLNNAMDAMPDGGNITITSGYIEDDNAIQIAIKDTGTGITKEDLKRIFDYFFTTKEPGKGTGLGLPICKQIVNDHGGTIDVQSEPDKGSIFIIKLPVNGERLNG
ncbi:MAG: HAMP domain-containing protein [Planctomycetes bacterium]|nr:HAMP domain-containing protein [Planctomycetota bacterium]